MTSECVSAMGDGLADGLCKLASTWMSGSMVSLQNFCAAGETVFTVGDRCTASHPQHVTTQCSSLGTTRFGFPLAACLWREYLVPATYSASTLVRDLNDRFQQMGRESLGSPYVDLTFIDPVLTSGCFMNTPVFLDWSLLECFLLFSDGKRQLLCFRWSGQTLLLLTWPKLIWSWRTSFSRYVLSLHLQGIHVLLCDL